MLGLCIGSFLNVCIFRIPLKQDIVKLSSHCMKCERKLRWYELIPVLSFILQGGKCRGCKEKLSVQYPLIELLNGLIYLYIFYYLGYTVQAGLYSVMASVLIVISVIDFRTFEIPLGCNIILFLLGVLQVVIDLPHISQYVIGFFAVSTVLFIIWLISKGRAIGGGDIKLLAAGGLILGWQNIIMAFLSGCIIGSFIHIFRMRFCGADRRLAFGPYLSAGILIAALWGDYFLNWYLGRLGLR